MLENKLGFIRTKWDDKNELGSAPIEKVSARNAVPSAPIEKLNAPNGLHPLLLRSQTHQMGCIRSY
ncbi:hypothetical protein [Ureibacillus thermophilus]|uniref:Uncharacterized protein n=1 Tax=Ureibacillus thermophilus TaxID=367743 RepID=A0A4P6UT80_9BACL|nr:hypothetical protein [Ureibacillus thermophilus]QBK25321.1 hypothetical protein DKZ56_05315 [Ureibacillus thermophilus]